MDKYGYNGPSQFRPLSPWAYFGYNILFSIPILGLILLIVFCFDGGNINRRNYARSFFCVLLLVLIIVLIMLVMGVSIGGLSRLFESK